MLWPINACCFVDPQVVLKIEPAYMQRRLSSFKSGLIGKIRFQVKPVFEL